MLFHLGTVHFTARQASQTLWQRLAVQTRVLIALLLVLAIALTPNGQWLTWGLYGVAILWILSMSQVPFLALLQRMMIEFTFVGVVLLGTLFRNGGTVLWQWGWLQITTTGLMILGSVMVKAFLSLLLLNTLTLTTSIPHLLQALEKLRTPPLLVAILGAMYRYLTVLIAEFQAMRCAALSRNLMGSAARQRAVVGSIFGSLFIRTYERGERIHHAMLARGYQGLPPPLEDAVAMQGRDRIALVLTVFIALLGQAVYFV